MSKVLIIKSGHSETWINDSNAIVSFGDVFRSTTLLQNFLNDEITWLGSVESRKLLPDRNNFIFIDMSKSLVNFESYDLVINLEKNNQLRQIPFQKLSRFCGFFFDSERQQWLFQNIQKEIFTLDSWIAFCESAGVIKWGEKLHFMLGANVQNTLGCIQNHQLPVFDFGLNWQVGKKWPLKQIGMEKWNNIHSILSKNYSVSWQEGFDSLEEYQNWIGKNRVLITLDSLGMHLSLAMKKPTLAIFTATSSEDVDSNPVSLFYTTSPADINFNFIAESAINLLDGK
jgi:heptosyltransferase-2